MLTGEQEDQVREIVEREIDKVLQRLIDELDGMSVGGSAARDVSAVSRILLRAILNSAKGN